MSSWFDILILVILIGMNGAFALSEVALITSRRARLQHMDEESVPGARRAMDMNADPNRALSTIQVGITSIGLLSGIFGESALAKPVAEWLVSLGMGEETASAVGITLVVVLLTYFSIVMGELVPKRIGLANAEGVSKQVVGPLSFFQKIARPLVWLTGACSDGLARILRIKSADDRQNVSEEEIKYMVSEQDDLLDEEKRMIHEIFDLGDTVAREVMVPRVDTTMCEDDETVADVLSTMRQTGFSRIPVYHEDPDNVAGIAHIKDLIQPSLDGKGDQPIADFLRDATFVPDTKDILPLLSEMQTSHDQIVVVVDEYGGTAGIITIEDIVEEIVGEIVDETDRERPILKQEGPGVWLADGRFPVEDAVEMGWPLAESEDYETIAGWVLSMLDTVPQMGYSFEKDGYRFTIHSMRRRRILAVRVERISDDASQASDGKAGQEER